MISAYEKNSKEVGVLVQRSAEFVAALIACLSGLDLRENASRSLLTYLRGFFSLESNRHSAFLVVLYGAHFIYIHGNLRRNFATVRASLYDSPSVKTYD